jgi:uncharacterized protein
MLTFDWDDVRQNGLSLNSRVDMTAVPELQALEEGEECEFLAPLEVDLRIFPAGDLLEVVGSFTTEIAVVCSRCLCRFSRELTEDFELSLAKELPQVTDEDGSEVELSADEMGLVLVETDNIDLVPYVAEQVIMALPYRVLCREDCRGVCASCGVDLNQQQCQCRTENVLNKFAALKDFKVQK